MVRVKLSFVSDLVNNCRTCAISLRGRVSVSVFLLLRSKTKKKKKRKKESRTVSSFNDSFVSYLCSVSMSVVVHVCSLCQRRFCETFSLLYLLLISEVFCSCRSRSLTPLKVKGIGALPSSRNETLIPSKLPGLPTWWSDPCHHDPRTSILVPDRRVRTG